MSLFGKQNPWARLLSGALAVATAVTMVPNTALAAPEGATLSITYNVNPDGTAYVPQGGTYFNDRQTTYTENYISVSEGGTTVWHKGTAGNVGDAVAASGAARIDELNHASNWSSVSSGAGWYANKENNSPKLGATISLDEVYDAVGGSGTDRAVNYYATFKKQAETGSRYIVKYHSNNDGQNEVQLPASGTYEYTYSTVGVDLVKGTDNDTIKAWTEGNGQGDLAKHHVQKWTLSNNASGGGFTTISNNGAYSLKQQLDASVKW